MKRSFASDNNAPVAPEIMAAIAAANEGDAVGYGADVWTARAQEAFRAHFGNDTAVYLFFNGTGANVVALSAVMRPWESVLTPATAHIQTDECGAFERFAGSKVIPIATPDGKLRPQDVEPYLHGGHDEHHAQPRVISISQATEYSDVYSAEETRALADLAHANGLLLHVDGARIANAAAALQATPRALTRDCGVDILTFGGTKNGLMLGEATCFFGREQVPEMLFARKQGMQLASKMRYIAAQFIALLEDDRWLSYASHSNAMAERLEQNVRNVPGVRLTRNRRCNALFASMDRKLIEALQEQFFFYLFDEALPEVRWMTHWATTPQDIDEFASALSKAAAAS